MGSDIVHTIDITVLLAYLALTFGFGIFANKILKSDTREEEGFFLAGRKMPGWLNGISNAVTAINADVAPVYFGVAVTVGLPVCWFYISRFSVTLLLGGFLFAARWRQLGVSTCPEFFSVRFGGRGGKFVRAWSSLYSLCLCMIPWIGTGMLGIHMIFGPIFGIESKTTTLLIILPIILVYVWISGFAGVLITDVMQASIIVFSSIVLLVSVLIKFGGPGGLVGSVKTVHANEASEILSIFPVPGNEVMGPLMVLAWFVVPVMGVGGNFNLEGQRIISCRNAKETLKFAVWTEIALFAMLLLLTLPALGAIAEFPDFYHASPAVRETSYGRMLTAFLPTGLLGLSLAALGASVMSTIDSHLNYGAQTLLNDVYRPLVGNVSERHAIWAGRIFMVIIMVVAIVIVYCASSLIGIVIILAGMWGSVALMAWGQWWWWRVNIWSWIAANIGGPVIYILLGYLLKHFDWWQQHRALGGNICQQLDMLKAFIAICINTAIWVTVTLLTKPEDMKVLKKFYLRAHPMGYWAPVRREIQKENPASSTLYDRRFLIFKGIATSLLGAVWISLLVLSLSQLFVGRYVISVFLVLVSALLAFCFKKVFNWYSKKLDL